LTTVVKNSCTEFHENPTSGLVVTEKDRQTEGHNIHVRRKIITSYRSIGTMGDYLQDFYGHTSPKLYALAILDYFSFRLTLFSMWFYKVSLNDLKSNEFAQQFMQLGEKAHSTKSCHFLNTSISGLLE
jgi:hypothetical protein